MNGILVGLSKKEYEVCFIDIYLIISLVIGYVILIVCFVEDDNRVAGRGYNSDTY